MTGKAELGERPWMECIDCGRVYETTELYMVLQKALQHVCKGWRKRG